MKHLTTFENFNVQDMMSIPTTITDKFIEYERKLQPFFDYIRNLKGINNISPITYEQIDNYYGFSFVAFYTKAFIVTDKKGVFILINEQLIPITNPIEVPKILQSESET